MLEVFDAARHAQHIALSISLYRSDKGFGYALWIDTSAGRKTEAPEVIWEHERVGCMWAMVCGTLCDASLFFFVSMGVCERGSGICVEALRSMEGWEDNFIVLIYAPVSAII